MVERIDVSLDAVLVHVSHDLDLVTIGHQLAKRVHRPKFPRGVDVEKRERDRSRCKGLSRKMQHH